MEKSRSKKAPLSRSTSIQVTDMDHQDKNKSDKKNHHSPTRSTTKNSKTEGQTHLTVRRKSTNDLRSVSPNKSDTKKHTSHTGNPCLRSSMNDDHKRKFLLFFLTFPSVI